MPLGLTRGSGGSGKTCLWPGATMLAPRKVWKYSVPPSERFRVEHRAHRILREQKCSVPSTAINVRPANGPSGRRNGSSTPAAAIVLKNRGSNADGGAPSSIWRMCGSVGMAVMANRVWQFDRPWPSSNAR